ncbi:MAG: fumarylacetoacetate hydrolase family protein [Candidatus Omnitrophota bacterium]|jgi:2-keto-4-pentenoate hydratase/2-oxohepta-3-ene-1,7-dioic acid hydratase in catechol pathway
MRLARFFYHKNIFWGVIEGNYVTILKEPPFKSVKRTSQRIELNRIRFLPPADCAKIVLAGLNYKDHAKELKMSRPQNPIIFLKPTTTLIAHNEAIIYPAGVNRLDYEAELAIVIKKEAKNIKPKDVSKYILGYTCLNDVTARDLQKSDGQWTRSKSFDTFCPLGPWIETSIDPQDTAIRLWLNGILKQNSTTKEFIFNIDYLVSFISNVMTLSPGDVVSTGTPFGVGPMKKGDIVEVEVEGVGKLSNYVE